MNGMITNPIRYARSITTYLVRMTGLLLTGIVLSGNASQGSSLPTAFDGIRSNDLALSITVLGKQTKDRSNPVERAAGQSTLTYPPSSKRSLLIIPSNQNVAVYEQLTLFKDSNFGTPIITTPESLVIGNSTGLVKGASSRNTGQKPHGISKTPFPAQPIELRLASNDADWNTTFGGTQDAVINKFKETIRGVPIKLELLPTGIPVCQSCQGEWQSDGTAENGSRKFSMFQTLSDGQKVVTRATVEPYGNQQWRLRAFSRSVVQKNQSEESAVLAYSAVYEFAAEDSLPSSVREEFRALPPALDDEGQPVPPGTLTSTAEWIVDRIPVASVGTVLTSPEELISSAPESAEFLNCSNGPCRAIPKAEALQLLLKR